LDDYRQIVGLEVLEAAFAKAPDIAREEFMKAMVEADALIEREVKDEMPTATGVSRSSITSYEVALPEGMLGVVGSSLPHVAYIELGSKPHFPPIQALEDWVRVKFGYNNEKEIRQAAFAIGRAISRKGTTGVHMFKKSFDRLQPRLAAIFIAARDRVAERVSGGLS
jgi:hypothetical protein